jgi:hypothetical protein
MAAFDRNGCPAAAGRGRRRRLSEGAVVLFPWGSLLAVAVVAAVVAVTVVALVAAAPAGFSSRAPDAVGGARKRARGVLSLLVAALIVAYGVALIVR